MVDLSSFGEILGEKLGIGTFAGGLLMGLIVLAIFLIPLAMISIKRGNFLMAMIGGISVYGFNVAVGWFPVWMFIILVFLIVLLFGKKIAGD